MKVINSYIPYGGGFNIPNNIIIHAMGEYITDGTTSKHAVAFLNDYKLSAHVLIASNGDKYICHPDQEIAHHARGHNTNSLGIEFLVEGIHNYTSFIDRIKTPYITDFQLTSGVEVTKEWIKLYNITKIQRHSDLSPDRKVDPGTGFPWDLFYTTIREI